MAEVAQPDDGRAFARMRVTGPEGLDEIFYNERDAILRALDWAGDEMDTACETEAVDELYDRLDDIMKRTCDVIWVREEAEPLLDARALLIASHLG